jgi:superfamily II DNA or RNA helicase
VAEGGFRDLELRVAYAPSDDPLHAFYLPTLARAVHYDRSTGYFSSGALIVAAQGLARLIANRGTMRLLVGAQLSKPDVEAIRRGAAIEEVARERLVALLQEPEDELARRRLEALAWMVATGALQIKVVLRRGPDGLPMADEGDDPYYHPKKGVFRDAAGDRVGFSGSINESVNAWKWHFEEFHVFRSWEPGERPHLAQVEAYFERVWRNEDPDWISLSVPEAVRQRLLRFCPDEAPERDPLERPPDGAPEPGPPFEDAIVARFLRDVPHLLDVGVRVGRATTVIQPWPNQLRVATRVVERFPERFLLADEVGLGKTIEVGLIVRDLVVSGQIERCLILAPAGVLQQWQGELREKFALEVPIYDGTRLIGPGPDRVEIPFRGPTPWSEVSLVLASSQLMKRRDRRGELLGGPDWDLVVVDEAHHARRKDFQDLSLRRPNRLLELLEGTDGLPGLAAKTRGLLLLTATPMQIHPVEVWDLLVQLGLAGRWGASEANFLRYFEQLRIAAETPADADWRFLAAMASDELRHGGAIDRRVEERLEASLGFAGWSRVRNFAFASDPAHEVRTMSEAERTGLLTLLRHLTPLRRRMFRHTRSLLRRYRERGLLTKNLADRKAEARWITFEPAEADLYRRIEEYISRFYRKYEGERKGLGFVMTVYRRRLTSSFFALQRSLERRLAFLQGRARALGLTDEDLEELDLAEDVTEVLPDEDGGEPLTSIYSEEISYVENFLDALRKLGSDTKFDQLQRDLDLALSKRDSVVVFTQYGDTVDYLKERLRLLYGSRVACYTGGAVERWSGVGWAPVSKDEVKDAFANGEVKILLGTDALAEGLNLQTCGVEINYDAPWNPMRLEQRIGRIDRIDQRYDTVWIWTYFYEDSVEARVYHRLLERIDLFTGVVGRLQPILHRIERAIHELALADPRKREDEAQAKLRALDEEIDRAEREGIDLDLILDEGLEPPATIEPPATLRDLASVLLRVAPVRSRFRPHPDIRDAYLVRVRGEEVAVTFEPAVADEHPERVRLLTFGDRILDDLLAMVEQPPRMARSLARVTLLEPSRPLVAWYRWDGSNVVRIDRLADLQAALRDGAPSRVPADLADRAADQFAGAVLHLLEAEQAAARKREDERLSALRERARALVERAACIWAARTSGQLSDLTVKAMIEREGYPFGPLALKVGEVPQVGSDHPAWAEAQSKKPNQLDGLWSAVRTEAKRLLGQIVEAERSRDAIEIEAPTPRVQARLV